MKRAFISVASAVVLAGAGFWFYYFGLRPDYYHRVDLWLVFCPAVGLLIAGLLLLYWAMSDNIHRLKAGTVIDHAFNPAHVQPATYIPGTPGNQYSPGTPATYIPARSVPDEWGLKIQDERGRTGWLYFSSDVLEEHPIGSYYQGHNSY